MRARLRRLAAALCLAAAAGVVATIVSFTVAGAQAPAPGLQYVAALHDAYDALQGITATSGADPAFDRVRAPLRLARELSPDPMAVDAVIGDLARNPVDLQDARQDLQTLIAAASFPQGSVAEDPGASQQTLHSVYAQSQFDGLGRRQQSEDLFTRIGSAVTGALRWLSQHTVGALGVVPTVLLASLLIAALLGYVFWRLHHSGTATLRRQVAPEPAARGTDPDDEWRQATAAAARGDHRDAVRHAFRSALLSIAVAGRLHVDAAWTTSELLAQARGDADLVAALAPAADAFDRAWYSGRPVSAEDWEVARERCQAVRALAGRRRTSAAPPAHGVAQQRTDDAS